MIQRHFTATGIVLNESGQALLILHKKLGVWLPPGGHVEPNETPDQAVLREIFEETGVRATLLLNHAPLHCRDQFACVLATPVAVFLEDIRSKGEHFHIDLIYRCRAFGQSGQHNPNESQALRWVDQPELHSLDTYHNVKSIVQSEMDAFHNSKTPFSSIP